MKCDKCGGNIERVSYNSDWNLLELWDCICENCGHMILSFPPECKECGEGILEFTNYNNFIDAGEGYVVGEFVCSNCLKSFLNSIRNDSEDLEELYECIQEYKGKLK